MKIVLDGASISNLDEFYDQIEKHLLVGECPWGRNLNSLDEIILCNFNYTENPSFNVSEIVWNNSQLSAEKLGCAETIRFRQESIDTLNSRPYQQWTTAQIEREILLPQRQILEEIERLKCGESQTIFELLKEILSSNESIKLTLA